MLLYDSWSSGGLIDASGGTVAMQGTWTDTGPITAGGGTLILEGTSNLAAGVAFAGGGGSTVELRGDAQ